MGIAENYRRIARIVATYPGAKLVAVVKKRTLDEIGQLIEAGVSDIAFNTLREAEEKLPLLNFSGIVHFIGHLQTNKIRKVLSCFDIIQSVDSIDLASRIDRIAGEEGEKTSVLLQINIANDPAKFGFRKEDALRAIAEIIPMKHLRVLGIMTIGKLVATEQEKVLFFRETKALFDEIRNSGIAGDDFAEISMGMSDDYRLALAEGATMVRVGSALFEKTCGTE